MSGKLGERSSAVLADELTLDKSGGFQVLKLTSGCRKTTYDGEHQRELGWSIQMMSVARLVLLEE